MKTYFGRFYFCNFGKLSIPAAFAFVIAMLATVNGCSQSDRSTDAREEVITQNALEAEAADANLAVKKLEPAKGKVSPEKIAKATKTESSKKAAKDLQKGKSEIPSELRKPAAAVAGGTYVVQVGAFKVRENADKLREKLAKAGYNVEAQTVEHRQNGTLHLVRFQPTTNRAEAETLIEDLSSKQDLRGQIITAAPFVTR